jgi:hypothetical protein
MIRLEANAVTDVEVGRPELMVRALDHTGTEVLEVLAQCELTPDLQADLALSRLGWRRVGPWRRTAQGAAAAVWRAPAPQD